MRLDGELWAGRGRFEAVGSLMGSKSLQGGKFYEMAWSSLTYVVFDAPHVGGSYLERLAKARARLAGVAGTRVQVVTPLPCGSAAAKDQLLERVTSAGGEGLVLRRVAAEWRCGSERRDQLKVKRWLDAEAEVISYKPAPTSHNLPSVLCRALNTDDSHSTFELAISRESKPPCKGTIVTFRYREISRVSGQYRDKSLEKIHDPQVCDCDFCSVG